MLKNFLFSKSWNRHRCSRVNGLWWRRTVLIHKWVRSGFKQHEADCSNEPTPLAPFSQIQLAIRLISAPRQITLCNSPSTFNRPTVGVKAHVMPAHYVFYNAAVTDPWDSEPRLCYLQWHRGLRGFSWNGQSTEQGTRRGSGAERASERRREEWGL